MISQEFKATVSDKNLLRTRIMLKDSFVVDPTFVQFDEMLSYARVYFPGLLVPFNGEYLENDEAKWNDNIMNEELVQLITNFSETRINHLKKVVSKVLEHEAVKIRRKRMEQSTRLPISSQFMTPSVSRESSASTRKSNRQKALRVLRNEGNKIQKIMNEVHLQQAWKPTNVDDMERAAREILKAAQDYKNNSLQIKSQG